jgi:hypothetical protein
MAVSLQRLNEDIVVRCTPKPPPPPPPPEAAGSRALVFVNTDPADLAWAEKIRAGLKEQKFGVIFPRTDVDDLDEKLELCHGLVLVFGKVPPTWVREQVSIYLRKQKTKPVGVFDAPPVPKDDFGIDLPELKHVETIEDLIAHLRT